jgi:alpha-N-arabinofuranosidase
VSVQPFIPGNSIIGSDNPIVPFGSVIDGWRPIGNTILSLDILHPLSETLPVALQVDIPWDATGEVGFLNEGWWGMDVRAQTYNASFFMLANGPRYNNTLTSINLSLRSNLTNEVWATTKIPIVPGNVSTFDFTQYQASIVNKVTAPDSNNSFAMTFDASEVAGATFYFGLISLFPETYNNRPNGLRKDLAQGIKDLNAKFLRFPGGNNIEGYSIFQRWNWRHTIGPLRYRKGRVGNWGYYNTNGLGLLEYLEWTEDLGMEPVLAIYAGFSLDIWGQEGTSYPEDRMGEIVQDILDELEYCMGDTNTQYGKLRAEHGHPEPFKINYIELGNEDWFSPTYSYRFPILYSTLKKAYPDITLISTAYNENANYTIDIPSGGMWDTHHYETPTFFLESFDFWDNWQEATNNTGVKIFIGEYSVFQIDTPSGVVNFSDPTGIHIFYPELVSAIAEAVYLIGAERNPSTVTMTSYAPSFQNLNWYNWTPNLVAFTANPNQTIFSTSYYMQKMLANHRGTQTLSVKNTAGGINPLWWVATIDEAEGVIFVKVCDHYPEMKEMKN